MTTTVSELKPGDYIPTAKLTVAEVQSLGPLVIIDFTDRTATAPIPGNASVEIERPNPNFLQIF